MDELKDILKDLSLFEPTCPRRPLRPPPPPPQNPPSKRPLPSTPRESPKSVSCTHVTTKLRPKTQEVRPQNLLSYEVTPPRPRGMTEAEKKVRGT